MSRSDDFQDFLQNSFNKPIKHIVVGNEAGDADSIVSALVWAFVKSNLIDDGAATEALTPVVSITKNDIETQRPETKLLLKNTIPSLSHLSSMKTGKLVTLWSKQNWLPH
jgi:inorganic pyrophosphatase/exopolyphosphatase